MLANTADPRLSRDNNTHPPGCDSGTVRDPAEPSSLKVSGLCREPIPPQRFCSVGWVSRPRMRSAMLFLPGHRRGIGAPCRPDAPPHRLLASWCRATPPPRIEPRDGGRRPTRSPQPTGSSFFVDAAGNSPPKRSLFIAHRLHLPAVAAKGQQHVYRETASTSPDARYHRQRLLTDRIHIG